MASPSSPQFDYVTLVSGDGFEFVIPRSTACISGTIRRMLEPSSEYHSLPPTSLIPMAFGFLCIIFMELCQANWLSRR